MSARSICGRCGQRGATRTVTRGSFLIEVVLWLAFLVPGLIYSIWRLTTRQAACATCGATDLIPESSPRGLELMAAYHPGAPVDRSTDDLPRGNATRGYIYIGILFLALIALVISFA